MPCSGLGLSGGAYDGTSWGDVQWEADGMEAIQAWFLELRTKLGSCGAGGGNI